jgi:hypothetical protein
MPKTAPDLVSELATKTTALHATVKKLEGKTADKNEPHFVFLQSIVDDSIDLLRKLQLQVNR